MQRGLYKAVLAPHAAHLVGRGGLACQGLKGENKRRKRKRRKHGMEIKSNTNWTKPLSNFFI